ncbi:6934_t:CDS:2 [Gigaspora margarita]|uniref:6934_t:CDS:1 n=1 Tax=Gigaspora margarita TaxID=4874 RepID=A0ABN7UI37_GIGMA|nr:6934_t:CDS:2 [Gigaspora margarita]
MDIFNAPFRTQLRAVIGVTANSAHITLITEPRLKGNEPQIVDKTVQINIRSTASVYLPFI